MKRNQQYDSRNVNNRGGIGTQRQQQAPVQQMTSREVRTEEVVQPVQESPRQTPSYNTNTQDEGLDIPTFLRNRNKRR